MKNNNKTLASKKYITRLSNCLDRIIIVVGNALSLMFLLAVVISIVEVILRYVFNSPTIWAHESTIFLCALCFVYGGSYCLAQDKHIRIDVVFNLLDTKWQSVVEVVGQLLCFIYLLAMTYAAWFVATSSLFSPSGNWQPETSGSAWDPAIPAIIRSFLFSILVLMSLQQLLKVFRLLARN